MSREWIIRYWVCVVDYVNEFLLQKAGCKHSPNPSGEGGIAALKRKFSKLLGRSPKDEILRVRIERVERLLGETDYPLETIAQLTGFGYVANMCSLFKKKTGRTPGEYRKTV